LKEPIILEAFSKSRFEQSFEQCSRRDEQLRLLRLFLMFLTFVFPEGWLEVKFNTF